MPGGVVSWRITWKVQEAELPALSMAVMVIVVAEVMLNPATGSCTKEGLGSKLSVTVTRLV